MRVRNEHAITYRAGRLCPFIAHVSDKLTSRGARRRRMRAAASKPQTTGQYNEI